MARLVISTTSVEVMANVHEDEDGNESESSLTCRHTRSNLYSTDWVVSEDKVTWAIKSFKPYKSPVRYEIIVALHNKV